LRDLLTTPQEGCDLIADRLASYILSSLDQLRAVIEMPLDARRLARTNPAS